MKKSILNLGTPIPKKSQQLIFGGSGCSYGSCYGDQICYHNPNGGTFCDNNDPNQLAVAPPHNGGNDGGMPRIVDDVPD
ncbi:hypothetical protein BTO06_03995 [Tenacibaculum sp. SZ-18]|uniref:hypothetical protein n=1 Tax=Tenacibaculum sp. SZ-18 TaxID=754423 RepID=UPI000C2CFC6A|nr:hypothetical protein [Tenacibaculum sp. SZ-18]AUC14354.1 hypothetical protein BTO06_03995 [Tenacibaculum sp. SZ-18]